MRFFSIPSAGSRRILLSGAALAALTPGLAFAQVIDSPNATGASPASNAPGSTDAQAGPSATTGPEATAPDASGTDVVVTARGRAERLQEVPLAITSIDSSALASGNVRNLRDIAYLTPGLQITSGGSEFGVNPIIRGQTNLNGGSGDPNVAVFYDGIYISNNTAINVGLIDVERVEVVKGPVSALYGHNAFAGAINYVSKQPSLTAIHGSLTGFYGNDGQYSGSGRISFPLIKDVLGVSLAAGYEHFDGSYHDNVTNQTAGGYKKRDFQGAFLFTPTSAFTVSGSYYHGKDTFGLSAIAYNANNCGLKSVPPAQDPSGAGYSQFCGEFRPDAHPVEVPVVNGKAGASGNDRTVNFASLKASYNLGPVTLSSLTGYTRVDQQRLTDFIGRRFGIPFTLVPGPGTATLPELFGSNTNNEDFSEEVRLQSSADKPLRVQVGGFYFKGRTFSTTILSIDGTNLPAGQSLLPGFAANSLTANGQISSLIIGQTLSHDKQYSGFAGVDWDILPGLTASGEYRYTHQKKDQLVIRSTGCAGNLTVPTLSCTGPGTTPYLFPNGPDPVAGTFNFSNYRGSLKYAITRGSNIYASVANGTKAGGFNQRTVKAADGSQPDLEFFPEKNTTYEVGLKNSLFDNRVQLNVAVYHIDTKDIQISGPSSVPTNPGLVTKNFGSVHTTGFEAEIAARPVTGLTLRAGVGYADPKFGKDAYDFGAAGACLAITQCAGRVIVATPGTPLNPVKTLLNGQPNTVNKNVLSLSGLSLPRENNLQVTTGVDVAIPLAADGWKLTGTYNGRYESKDYAFNNNISYYGPRINIDLRVGVENDTFSISGYVNNLTNDHTPEILSVNARLSDFQGDLDGYLPVGREYGVTASAKF